MDFTKFKTTWAATASENKLLKSVCGGLVIANVMLVGIVYTRGTETILVPPAITEKMTVSQSSLDASGKKQWSAYVASLVGNITPGNIDYTIDQLQGLMDSVVYHKMRQDLAEQVQKVKRDNITLAFEAKQLMYEKETGKVFVIGRSILRATNGVEQKVERVFEIELNVEEGRPLVTHLESYDGAPHTQYWLQNQRAKDAEAAAKRREDREAARDAQQ